MNKSLKIFSLLALAFFTIISCNDDDDSTIAAGELKAAYTFIIESASSGEVSFINTSENAESYLWDFGDGTTSTIEHPFKVYDASGDYQVTLTVTHNSTGSTDTFTSTVSVFVFDGGMAANGDFESGTTGWKSGVDNPIAPSLLVTENGNTYYSVNVATANPGSPFVVNLSQTGLNMTEGTIYTLTFDAWSDVNRTMLAGIGLSGPPWTNITQTVNITPMMQNYSIDLEANFTDMTNSRIIFDLGGAAGQVNIDNVTLNPAP